MSQVQVGEILVNFTQNLSTFSPLWHIASARPKHQQKSNELTLAKTKIQGVPLPVISGVMGPL